MTTFAIIYVSIYFLLYVLVWFSDSPLFAIFSFFMVGIYGALIPLIPYGVLFGILYAFGVISEESQLHHVLFSIYLALASIFLVYLNREELSEIGNSNTSSVVENNTHQVKNSGFSRKEEEKEKKEEHWLWHGASPGESWWKKLTRCIIGLIVLIVGSSIAGYLALSGIIWEISAVFVAFYWITLIYIFIKNILE